MWDNDSSLVLDLNIQELLQIESTIREFVPITPVMKVVPHKDKYSPKLISIKLETETSSGSFKIRGASYLLKSMIKMKNFNHLYAASTGNHGISLALIAKELGFKVTVIVPIETPLSKIKQIVKNGARLIRFANHLDDSLTYAEKLAKDSQGTFISSTHHLLIKGHTSLGFELFNQAKLIDVIFFPIGVGSGIASLLAVRNLLSTKTKIIGVVPDACPGWLESIKANQCISSIPTNTIAEGLRTARPDARIFEFVKNHINSLISVNEAEIRSAMTFCKENLRTHGEGAGVVGLAGLLKLWKQGSLESLHVSTIVCGGEKVIVKDDTLVEKALIV